jgi:hypothetical protein
MLPPPFVCVAGDCKKTAPANLLFSAKRSERSSASTALSYAANVHYASLNIIFVSVCKFINFRSSANSKQGVELARETHSRLRMAI